MIASKKTARVRSSRKSRTRRATQAVPAIALDNWFSDVMERLRGDRFTSDELIAFADDMLAMLDTRALRALVEAVTSMASDDDMCAALCGGDFAKVLMGAALTHPRLKALAQNQVPRRLK